MFVFESQLSYMSFVMLCDGSLKTLSALNKYNMQDVISKENGVVLKHDPSNNFFDKIVAVKRS